VARDGQLTHGVLRRFMSGSGPLKRASDRLEVLTRVLLVCSVLAAVPIALTVASETHAQAEREAVAEASSRHQSDATLLEDAPWIGGGSEGGVAEAGANAVWTGPDGVERTGQVVAPAGTKAGATVSVWLDAQGERTSQPLTGGDVTARSVGMAVLTFLGLSALASAAQLSCRTALHRGRIRRWAREWAAVEPGWTHRVP
jgi:hypothetical protein